MANEETLHKYPSIGTFTLRQTVTGAGGAALSTTKTVNATGTVSGTPPQIRAVSKFANRTLGASSFTMNHPAGTVNGDLLGLIVHQRASNPTIPAPTGWTFRGSITNVGNQAIFLFSKVFATGGVTSVTVSSSATNAIGGIIVGIQAGTYLGTGNPFEILGSGVEATGNYPGTSAVTYTVPAITTTLNNALQFVSANILQATDSGGFITNSGDTLTATSGASAGFTLDAKLDGVSNAGATEVMLGGTGTTNLLGILEHRTVATAGTTATATLRYNGAGNQWEGLQFAVKAAQTIPAAQYTARFAGDPGTGFSYLSWLTEGDNYTEFKNEVTRMKAITYTGGAANNARNPVLFKYQAPGQFSNLFGSGQIGRTVVSEGRIPFITWNWSAADCANYMAGDSAITAFVTTLITDLNATFAAFANGRVWLNLLFEPDKQNGLLKGFITKADRDNARAAQRKFVNALRAGGVTRLKAAFVGPVLTPASASDSVSDYNGGLIQGDPWWEYYPDFKGYPSRGLNWVDGWTPAVEDFYVYYSSTLTASRTVDISGFSVFCLDSLGSGWKGNYVTKSDPANNIWNWTSVPGGPYTPTVYEAHDLASRAEATGNTTVTGHAWAMRKILDNLYGKNVMGIVLAQYAFPVAEFEAREFNGFPNIIPTRDQWKHIAQEHADYGIVGSFYSRQEDQYGVIEPDANIWALGYRFGQGFPTTVSGVNYDGGPWAVTDLPTSTNGTDARRKGLAAQMDMTVQLNAVRLS